MSSMDKILVTTAISYTNGSPHIGHLYESILGDFINRIYKVTNHESKFLTGTDEHGKKIQEKSSEVNMTPIKLCNKYSKEFINMNDAIGNKYDHFIRTTSFEHLQVVIQSINHILNHQDENNKLIYLTNYSGYYNVREESYITEFHASETDYKDPISGKPYEIVNEETFNFKLQSGIDDIHKTINNIIPDNCQHTIKTRVDEGLRDISITRTTFNWGIPFPIETEFKHVIYVWFDALLNYITGKYLLYGDCKNKIIHLIGKDIVWFHSVIYPAILKASGHEKFMPDKILVHGFILDKDGKKMSKSLGNTIANDYLLEKYPVEAIRYYFINNTVLGQDLKFNEEVLVESFNKVLINNFGNLFQRLYKIIRPIKNEINDKIRLNNDNIMSTKNEWKHKVISNFLDTFNFNYYNDLLHSTMIECNKVLTEKMPWKLDMIERVDIIYNILALRITICIHIY